MKKEQRTPEYLAINPFGKVPAIVEDDGFILFESSTVLRYLANTRDVPDHWYPKDPKKRAQVDLFLDIFQATTKSMHVNFFSNHPELAGPYGTIANPNALAEMEKCLTDVQSIFLQKRKFIASDEISIADIQFIFFFGSLEIDNYDLKSKFPKLQEWKDAVLATGIKPDYLSYLEVSKQRIVDAKAKANADKQ